MNLLKPRKDKAYWNLIEKYLLKKGKNKKKDNLAKK